MHLITGLFLSNDRIDNAITGAILGGIGALIGLALGSLLSKIFKNKKLVSLTSLIFVLIALQLPKLIIKPYLLQAGYSTSLSKQNILSTYRQAADAINARSPYKVDELTTMISAEGRDDGIIYNYRLGLPAVELPPLNELSEKLRKLLVDGVCKNSGTRASIELGDTFVYNYSDNSGKFLASIPVKKSDCM